MTTQPEEMGAFFDRVSDGYDDVHKTLVYDDPEAFYTKVADSITPTESPIHILDLGVGTGLELNAVFSRSPHAHITGIDLSGKMLALLAEKYADRSDQLTLIQGSYLDPLPGETTFDYAISVMSMHHLLTEKKLAVYQNIRQLLKPGGKYIEGDYIVSQDAADEEMAAYQAALGAESATQDGVYHLDIPMTAETLTALLRKAGFSTVDVIWQQEVNAILVAEK
ncbi:MAG: class I SAM-dependent methyltransferase [Anaerolineae bacterium]|nr:class I SAM-dependent methyltransferase [Anaerolineae bacterium]